MSMSQCLARETHAEYSAVWWESYLSEMRERKRERGIIVTHNYERHSGADLGGGGGGG